MPETTEPADDPRMQEPGDRGMPGSLDDRPANQPGDHRPPVRDDLDDDESGST